MAAPLISVLVTCYNLGTYLEEAVTSVLAQSVRDVEILIVDDGSTDAATVRLLASPPRWPRTTVHRTANQGLARARNHLLALAAGTYVCALDADDRVHPQYFAKALAAFDDDPGLTFVASGVRMFGAEERIWQHSQCDLPTLLAEDTVMTAALTRRDVVVGLGGYDEQMPAAGDEDWDLWIRIVAAGHRGRILQEVLFDYRRRPGSMGALCVMPDTHTALLSYLMNKHRALYAAHWRQIARRKDVEIAHTLAANDALEREIAERLLPGIARVRREVAHLRGRLEGGPGRTQASPASPRPPRETQAALRRELTSVERELDAIRRSWSWRLTAPLRRLGARVKT